MTDLAWFDATPPERLTLDDVTRLLRVLSGRPRRGLVQRLTPIVVFELRLSRDGVRWLFGCDRWMARTLPAELRAQLPDLSLVAAPEPDRRPMTTAREVRFTGLAYPLRLDTGDAVAAGLYHLAAELAGDEQAVVQWVVGPSNDRRRQPPEVVPPLTALGFTQADPPAGEQQLWKTKVAEPLFGVRGRIGVQVGDPKRAALLLRSLQAGLWLASGPQVPLKSSHQSSRTARLLHDVMGSSRTWSSLVNARELAVLIGWPVDGAAVPNRGVSLAPPPPSLLVPPEREADSRLLGRSLHPASRGRAVMLPIKAALSHSHLIGPTGSGKSTLLAQLIAADAAAGRSVLVVEPKGDLVTDVLRLLPPERHDDVIVIEPSDSALSVGLNPLAGPPAEAERRADELLALFRELFGSAIGPRSSDVLLHALITAARLPDGSLVDVPALLTQASFRRRVLAGVSDPLVLGPFWAGFEAALSDRERTMVVAPLMNKLRVLTTRAAIRRMLGQPAPGFQLDALFNERKIVLVNLNKGLIGPETARLLGTLVLSQLWRAIQRRAATPAKQRQPVTVMVDEWQDFAGALDFSDVLSTSRGLGVGWTLAHQHLGQLLPTLQAAVLANARNRVVFRPAQKDAAGLAAVLGAGVTAADLERLGAYQAAARVLVDNAPSPAFTLATEPLPAAIASAARLRRASQQRYGRPGQEIDDAIRARCYPTDSAPDAPIGSRRRRPQP
ncbi:type IV secretory system conjugative DNA transfer family protein [Pseudonocardia eucalypti]|uniref:Type IV secretory system conjugative DNA transfer family protein n=1 Tax=Pseudonocardia eucalypti TaxID=648755 RepID=A0ABP9Q7V1_9PSEU|nr:hypothetical protein [Pseudonocardia eucalypti]